MTLLGFIAHATLHAAPPFLAAAVLAALSWFLRRLPTPWRWTTFVPLSFLLLACPLLIPGNHPFTRGLVAGICAWWWLKTWDTLHRGASNNFSSHLLALINFGSNVTQNPKPVRHNPCNPRPWGILGLYTLALLLAVGLGSAVFLLDWTSCPFALEHTAKVFCIALTLFCLFNLHSAIWRVAGNRVLLSPVNVFWSTTPAEFWRRWNRPVQEWFFVSVFRPLSGAKRLALATLAAFTLSGLLHEYLFAMFIGRVMGYVTAFYLLQAFVVLATIKLQPRGPWRLPAIALTWTFLALTSLLHFAPFQTTFPLYANPLPSWLPFLP